MPLETGSTIADLDQSWPLGGDPANRGDDHLRLIKAILKAQFPGETGEGFNKPVIVTEDEINFLDGTTSNVHDDITELQNSIASLGVNLNAPVNTKMVFFNAGVPNGWTQETVNNDYMIRIINTAGGGKGGTGSPVSANFNHVHTTGSIGLTEAQNGPHRHQNVVNQDEGDAISSSKSIVRTAGGDRDYGLEFSSSTPTGGRTSSSGTGAAHNHGNTGVGNLAFTPKYLNMIVGIKNE